MRGLMFPPGLSRFGRIMQQPPGPFNRRDAGMAGLPRKSIVWPVASVYEIHGALPTAAQNNIAGSGPRGNCRMDDVRERFQNLHEFLKVAKFNLNRNNWDYITGGVETETTLARNRQS